ncbi:MAG: cell division protein FtsL [Gammaproteobacteria bacterium]|nr:cell division protein FtsL [Gammaproteobacteria bacterium]
MSGLAAAQPVFDGPALRCFCAWCDLRRRETRQQYAEIQQLERTQDHLDSEYEKLLLEQSAWADYARVDRISREELGMTSPAAKDIVVVTR